MAKMATGIPVNGPIFKKKQFRLEKCNGPTPLSEASVDWDNPRQTQCVSHCSSFFDLKWSPSSLNPEQ